MADAHKLSEEIDLLLVKYLDLLDQFTTSRAELAKLQSSVQQNIARANFTAERGLRYGQDQYDERMQATRRVMATPEGLEVQLLAQEVPKVDKPDDQEKFESHDDENTSKDEAESAPIKSKDPIRMFGILVPPALRLAQSDSIRLVEEVIPKLATLNKQMEEMEIEIRRKRKYKAKAEAKSLVVDNISNHALVEAAS